MRALGAMRYERGVQALTELFQYLRQGRRWRQAALDALAHIAHPSSVPLFVAQLTGQDAGASSGMAIEGLARTGDRRQLAAIEAVDRQQRAQRRACCSPARSRTCMLADGSIDAMVEALGRPQAARPGARIPRSRSPPGRAGRFARSPAGSRRARARRHRRTRSASPAIRRRCRSSSRCARTTTRRSRAPPSARDRPPAARAPMTAERCETAARVSTIGPRSTSRAICSARSWSTTAAACARAASSSKSRPTSANPIRPVTPRPGRTRRNAPLYGPPGLAYVYLNYGIHCLVNVVTEAHGRARRRADPRARSDRRHRRDAPPARARDEGPPRADRRRARPTHDLCRGPGNLTMAMGITLAENRLDLCGERLFIEERGHRGRRRSPGARASASGWESTPWRVYLEGHPSVSGRRRLTSWRRDSVGSWPGRWRLATAHLRLTAGRSTADWIDCARLLVAGQPLRERRRLVLAQRDAVVDALDRLSERARGGRQRVRREERRDLVARRGVAERAQRRASGWCRRRRS